MIFLLSGWLGRWLRRGWERVFVQGHRERQRAFSVADAAHEDGEQGVAAFVNEGADGGSVTWEKRLGRCGFAEIGSQKLSEDFAGHHPMSIVVGMHAVRLELEGGVGFSDFV